MKKHSYRKLITHHRPGLDEITSIFLLKRHAADWGITQDTVVGFMSNGDYQNPSMPEGILYVGCGIGSWANEHYLDINDSSACRLVARELRLDPFRYRDLVDAVTREDRHGVGTIKNHIAQSVKDLYDMGWSFHQVYKWVAHALVAMTTYRSQIKFSLDTDTCANAIEKKFGKGSAEEWFSVVTKIRSWDKKEFIKACAYLDKNPHLFTEVETYKGKMKAFIPDDIQDNARIGPAARSKGAQVILMQGELDYKQTGIMLQQKHTAQLSFSVVLEELRKHELMHRGQANLEKVSACAGEGTIEVCPIWHGHQAAQGQFETFAIYNRSKSRPLGPATEMSFEYIKDLVLDALTVTPQGEIVKGTNQFLVGGANLGLHRAFEKK